MFDPNLRWLPSYESRNTPTSSVLQGADGKLAESFTAQNLYFRYRTPWQNGQLSVDFENGRNSTSNLFTGLNPYLTSRLLVSYTQPLLRDRGADRDRTEIRVRRKSLDIAQVDYETKVIDIITRVQQSYWDLVAVRQDLQVTSDAVELGRLQLARTQRMIASGTLAPVEESASRAELERRLDAYDASVGLVTQAENALKILLAPDREATIWGDQIIPADLSAGSIPEFDDYRAVVADALKSRPELRNVALRKQQNDIQKEFAANQTKPQLNLVGTYATMGLAGVVNSVDNPFTSSQAALYSRLNQLSTLAGLAPVPGSDSFRSAAGVRWWLWNGSLVAVRRELPECVRGPVRRFQFSQPHRGSNLRPDGDRRTPDQTRAVKSRTVDRGPGSQRPPGSSDGPPENHRCGSR